MSKPKSKIKKPYIAAVFVVFLLCFMAKNALAVDNHNITDCVDLNESGTYYLTSNITNKDVFTDSGGTRYWCIEFLVNDTILDCQNNIIDGINDADNTIEGVDAETNSISNISIINCYISDWGDAGIYLYTVQNSLISSVSVINNSGYGINIDSTININLTNVTSSFNVYDGLIIKDSDNIHVENSIFKNSSDEFGDGVNFQNTNNSGVIYSVIQNNNNAGLTFSEAVNNITISNNLINQSQDIYFYQESTNRSEIKYNNTLYGNYWTNSTGTGYSDTCTDLLLDGICDDPYDIEAGVACAAVADGLPACGNSTDWLPLSNISLTQMHAEQEPCVPSWNCTAWGECVRGTQTRTCYDTNYCDDNSTIPALSQECVPNATANFTDGCCPISTFRCLNNDTVIQLWNTSDGDKWAVKDCQGLGCQNGECNQPTWINSVIILIIVGVVLFLIYKVV